MPFYFSCGCDNHVFDSLIAFLWKGFIFNDLRLRLIVGYWWLLPNGDFSMSWN